MAVMLLVVFGSMVVEARRASLNERAQRARGGIEPADDVFRFMRIVYPVAFLAMFAEGFVRGRPSSALILAGAVIFAAAKALKWWAVLSLGPFWTFRVIVVPGAPRVVSGPYRWLRHPNYLGVLGELAGMATFLGSPVSGTVAVVAFAGLLIKRIEVEERMLDTAAR